MVSVKIKNTKCAHGNCSFNFFFFLCFFLVRLLLCTCGDIIDFFPDFYCVSVVLDQKQTFSITLVCHLNIRDLKIRQRRRQRERPKNNRLRLAKQQLCTCITLFCTFLCRPCTNTTRKCLISRFMENVNKLLWNFLSHSERGYGFSGIQLQESSPTFDKVSELELSRWRLNEREFTF